MATVVAGSLGALAGWWTPDPTADVVALLTPATFSGTARAHARLVAALGRDVEGLEAPDRASAQDPGLVARVARADAVVLVEGSALHARSVWRHTALLDALGRAELVALGEVATVLGTVMIDPRGGAPTNGLGRWAAVALTVPASPAQLARTRALLAPATALVVVGPAGIVREEAGRWSLAVATDVEVTRGAAPARLEDVGP